MLAPIPLGFIGRLNRNAAGVLRSGKPVCVPYGTLLVVLDSHQVEKVPEHYAGYEESFRYRAMVLTSLGREPKRPHSLRRSAGRRARPRTGRDRVVCG